MKMKNYLEIDGVKVGSSRATSTIPKDKLCVVQFMHSGCEWTPRFSGERLNATVLGDNRINVKWNSDDAHYRRFVQHLGWYVDGKGKYKSGNLAFWTEWEASTVAMRLGTDEDFFKAHFVHNVQYPQMVSGARLCRGGNMSAGFQNTDPCVIGDTFKYSNCHQSKYGVLRRLALGSLVVFGSYKKRQLNQKVEEVFCLDTVFVVGSEGYDYVTGNVDSVPCSEEYKNLTLRRLSPGHDYTFYRGKSCRSDVNLKDALFSFTPVKPCSENILPSERCVLKDVEVLNKHLRKMVFKRKRNINFHAEIAEKHEIKAVWDTIVDQVVAQGFSLGVQFGWPQK